MKTHDLVAFVCEDTAMQAAATITQWITESRRFEAFVETYRTKIRKKLRTAAKEEQARSVLIELDVARRFVEDRRFAVEYERYGQGRLRSPDLTVTFRSRTVFHVEISALQSPDSVSPDWEGKIAGLVGNKLGQMISEHINILVLNSAEGSLSAESAARAMKRLKLKVESRDTELLSRLGFRDPSGFFKQYQWLSGISAWAMAGSAAGRGTGYWPNPQAKHSLPAAVVSLITN